MTSVAARRRTQVGAVVERTAWSHAAVAAMRSDGAPVTPYRWCSAAARFEWSQAEFGCCAGVSAIAASSSATLSSSRDDGPPTEAYRARKALARLDWYI